MSFVTVLVKKLFGFLFGILGGFKKLLCFLNIKRGRKNSGSILPMHADPVANSIPQSVPSNDDELESWDNWVEGGAPASQNPAGYDPTQNRRPAYNAMNAMKPVFLSNHPEPEPEPDIDFFQDMTPKIKKAAKILVKKKEEQNGTANFGLSSRLAMSNDVHLSPIDVADEDEDTWQEGAGESAAGDGWGEEAMEDLSWQAESALREKKRQERERKISEHQRRKQQREMMRGSSGAGAGAQLAAVKLS